VVSATDENGHSISNLSNVAVVVTSTDIVTSSAQTTGSVD